MNAANTTLFHNSSEGLHRIILCYDTHNGCRFSAWSIRHGASKQILRIEFKVPCSYNEFDQILAIVTHQSLKELCRLFDLSLAESPEPCTLRFTPHLSLLSQTTGCGTKPWIQGFATRYAPFTLTHDFNTLQYDLTQSSLPRELSVHTLPTQELIRALQSLTASPAHYEQFTQLYHHCIQEFISDLSPIDEQRWCRTFSLFLLFTPPHLSHVMPDLSNCITLIQNRIQRSFTNGSERLLSLQLILLALFLEQTSFSQGTPHKLGIQLCLSLENDLKTAQQHKDNIQAQICILESLYKEQVEELTNHQQTVNTLLVQNAEKVISDALMIENGVMKIKNEINFLLQNVDDLQNETSLIIPDDIELTIKRHVKNMIDQFTDKVNTILLENYENERSYLRDKIIKKTNKYHASVANNQSIIGRIFNRHIWTPMNHETSDSAVIAGGMGLQKTQELATKLNQCIIRKMRHEQQLLRDTHDVVNDIMSQNSTTNNAQSISQTYNRFKEKIHNINILHEQMKIKLRMYYAGAAQSDENQNQTHQLTNIEKSISIINRCAESIKTINQFTHFTYDKNALILHDAKITLQTGKIREEFKHTPTSTAILPQTQIYEHASCLEQQVQKQRQNQHKFCSQISEATQINALSQPLTKPQQNTLEAMHHARSTWNAVPKRSFVNWATLKPMSDELDTSLEGLNRSDDDHISITALVDLTCKTDKKITKS